MTIRTIGVLLMNSVFYLTIFSQNNPPSHRIIFLEQELTLSSLISNIETQSDFFVSYNSQDLNVGEKIYLTHSEITLDQIVSLLRKQLDRNITINRETKKIVILPYDRRTISGIIVDSLTMETLFGVAVYGSDGSGTFSNEEGYFHFKTGLDTDSMYVKYLGYRTIAIPLEGYQRKYVTIQISSDNRLPDIIIRPTEQKEISPTNSEQVDIYEEQPVSNIGGRSDLITTIKSLPGISVGSEAQNGFTVRGGGPDQNLVLIDGIPVYETSHLGGLSSIFSENMIKNANLYKSGIPANFGSKLSSVLDIRLKDGSRTSTKRKASINLENFSGFIEGPIGDKTSFIFNGRVSLINLYSSPILREFFDIEQSDLNYFDFYAKLSHWFSPTSRLSLSFYSGEDNIFLRRANTNSEISFIDSNGLGWNNRLATLNWSTALSEKVYFHSQIGLTEFIFQSRSANRVTGLDDSSLSVDVESTQMDLVGKANIEIFTDQIGKIKLGGGWTIHQSAPSILETSSLVVSPEERPDSVYISQESYVFLDYTVDITNGVTLQSGFRGNLFSGLDTTYFYLEPRISLEFKGQSNELKLGYSRMSQFLHLLVNPSSGLPSDLWVPSTKRVAPERSNLLSAEYRHKASFGSQFSIGGFYNTYDGLIEYINPFEIIQVIVQNHSGFNADINDVNWEDRVTTGTGRAYGLEIGWAHRWPKLSANLSYTLSRSERTFQFNNLPNAEALTFPHKYDRPDNMSANVNDNLKNKGKVNLTWLFGNGNTWTFTQNTVPGPDGNPILDPKERNNVRLSNYHRLGISYQKKKSYENGNLLEYSIGIYNAYNNSNPFYSFIRENDSTAEDPFSVVEISLYPVFPQFNISYTW